MAEPSRPDQPVRFGVLGCAKIAWKLVRAMLKAEEVVPYAVASRSLEKAETFVEEVKGIDPSCSPIPYGSYEELLSDPGVEAVYIPLPTGIHMEWVVKSAEHGKHILLEKPVALNSAELEVMLAACDKAGVQIMDGTMWMHNPRAAAIRDILQDSAKFGSLRRINSNFYFKGDDNFMESNIRVQKGLDELGSLGDVGWYCIRASLWAKNFELPEQVVAMPGTQRNSSGVIVSCGATLVWSDGAVATFDCGFITPLRQVLQIAGTRGTIRLDDFTIPHREDSCQFLFEADGGLVDGGTRSAYADREEVILHLTKPQETLMIEAFARILRRVRIEGRLALEPSWMEMMRKTQRVLDAVNESSCNNCANVPIK